MHRARHFSRTAGENRSRNGLRRSLALIASGAIVAAGMVATVGSSADAFEIPVGTWTSGATVGAVAMPSGVTVTVTGTGNTTNNGTATAGARGWSATQYSPALVTGDSVTSPRVNTGGCNSTGTCSGLGTLTVAFSQPVQDPVLHLSGIGGAARSGNNQSDLHAVMDLATPGVSLTKVAGNEQLAVSGTRVTATNDSTSANCTTTVSGGTVNNAAASAACGSVRVNGTVTSVQFTMSAVFVRNSGADGPANTSGSGDAFGLTVTLSQDFGDAPATYNPTQAPAHIIGDARLGSILPDADNVAVRNGTTSPFAGAAADGDNLNNINDEDAFTTLPVVLAGVSNSYSMTVPISGISETAYVCGYIDFDKGGTFDTVAERACATVAAGATSTSLAWTVPAATTAGTSYARFRVGYTQAQVQSPTGVANSGEVEDYTITFAGRPTITVNKVTESVAGGPFGFTLTNATQTTGTVTTTAAGTATQVDGNTGSAGLQPFTAASVNTAVTIDESSTPAGWALASATCTDATGSMVGTLSGTTYTLPAATMTPGAAITCTFTNGRPTVTVSKVWVVDGQSYAHGSQPAGMAAQLSLTGPAPAGASAQAWGVARAGYSLGSSTTVNETTTLSGEYAYCTVTAVVTQINGTATNTPLPAAGYALTVSQRATTAQITNTVVCAQSLTLVKAVSYGAESPSTWMLTATAPAGAVAGPSGHHSATTPVTAPVTANVAYGLAESGGPANYTQIGAWSCVYTATPSISAPVTNGAVTVPRGRSVTCTVTNATATITLLKNVVGPLPGFEAQDWQLTATPTPLAGLVPVTRTGAETDVAGANTFEVRPEHAYTLSESTTSSTLAYRQVRLERRDGANWVPQESFTITAPSAGHNVEYRFVNERIPAVILPLTGGMGTDTFLIAGGILLAMAAAAAVWAARRRRGSAAT